VASSAPSIRRTLWFFFGLAWTIAGGVGWFFLWAIAAGPCPKDGQYMFDPMIAHALGALWIIGGWLWIRSRMKRIPNP
jgi:hypothetical protein